MYTYILITHKLPWCALIGACALIQLNAVIPVKGGLHFQNNLQNLDPSFKTDLDFWDCFGGEKPMTYYKEIQLFITENSDSIKQLYYAVQYTYPSWSMYGC